MTVLSEKETWERLDAFEEKSGVIPLLIAGVPAWQVLRFSIAMKIQNLSWNKAQVPRKELYTAILRGLIFWRLRPATYMVQSLYSGARLQGPDGYGDVWFDDILENIPGGTKFVRFNAPGYTDKQTKLRKPFSYDTTLLIYLASAFARLFPAKDPEGNAEKIAALSQPGLGLSYLTPAFLRKRISVFLWQKRLLKILLRIVRPRTVIVIDSGEFALMNACQDLGIRFFELQHGVFTRFHPRSLRRKYTDTPGLLHPDVFGLYGKFWEEELVGTHYSGKKNLRVIGNALQEKYRAKKEKTHSVPTLVLTTQPFNLGLEGFLKNFLECTKDNFLLIIKLHPASGKDPGALGIVAGDPRVKILSAAEGANTYDLIATADYHLSVFSACHYDALAIGTPTVVIALDGHELMDNLVSEKLAVLVKTPQELAELIRKKSTSTPDAEGFCASGFYERMRALV